MAIADEGVAPTILSPPPTARRVRIPDYLNWWKPRYADWELPDINITHLVSKFVGKFDLAAWNRSIDLLFEKYPILAARVEMQGEVAEFVLESGQTRAPLTIIDLPPFTDKGDPAALQKLAAALVWQPFDREDGRLFRAFIIRVSDRECVLGIVVHHGIVDGWSMNIIGRELLVGYAAAITGRPNTLPRSEIQYLDYIEWMRAWLESPEAQRQKEYWAQQMMNSQSLRLPTQPNIDFETKTAWVKEPFPIDPQLVATLGKRASQTRATPFLFVLTAKIAALACVTGTCDIVVVIAAEQRTQSRWRNTVGILVNASPIRATVNWNESFDELAAQVRETYLKACANQTYPYTLINPQEDAYPFFRFRRIVGENEAAEQFVRGFQFFGLPPQPPSKTPAKGAGHELFVLQTENSMTGRVQYLPTLHTRETVTHFIKAFCRALALGAYDGASPLSVLRNI
jgi:hypothetical protein